MKVKFFDKNVRNIFWKYFSIVSAILSFILLFNVVQDEYEDYLIYLGLLFAVILIIIYIAIWFHANNLTDINIDIDGSVVNIKCGDIFLENGLKVIAFNEYFDTLVNDKIIAKTSLNGIFINRLFGDNPSELDEFITAGANSLDVIDSQCQRALGGKTIKFKLSTVFVYKDFVLTAFTKFDEHNKATLTMPEYLEFLINFWDRINRVYAQQTVSVPVFGSGITRIKEHKNIADEDLLKIMLWTFKLSEMKFKHPAKLAIIIHESKIDRINLFNLKSIELDL